MMRPEQALEIAQTLMEAAKSFAQKDPYPDQSRQSWSVWWYRVPEAEELFRRAVEATVRANPSQLSYADTAAVLTYRADPGFTARALGDPPESLEALERALAAKVLELVTSHSTRRLQFVIENLVADGEVPHFFGVELAPPTDAERQSLYDDVLVPSPNTNAVSLATVEVRGDETLAFDSGIRLVERCCNLLRGCGCQFMLGRVLPFHVIARNPVVEITAYRELHPQGYRTIARTEIGTAERYGSRVLTDLLVPLNHAQRDRLALATNGDSSRLLDAVVAALETLGQACKPNLPSFRLLLVSTALEMMVGARSSDDVSFRGQTAAVAERTVFLIAEASKNRRIEMDKRTRKLYGKGSAVRHGERPEVTADEISELASITLRVALSLLSRADVLKDHQDLDAWVQEMRYTTK